MVTIRVIADWNNNGVFDSTEDISTDVRRLSWTRGREAEQGETPAGTLTVELKDPVGDYSPHNSGSKWGGSNVTLNRELLAQAIYGGTTYGLFRGRIQSIKPQITAEEQRASIFCIDGMDELTRKIFSDRCERLIEPVIVALNQWQSTPYRCVSLQRTGAAGRCRASGFSAAKPSRAD